VIYQEQTLQTVSDVFYTCSNVSAMLHDTIFTVCKEKALTHKFF